MDRERPKCQGRGEFLAYPAPCFDGIYRVDSESLFLIRIHANLEPYCPVDLP